MTMTWRTSTMTSKMLDYKEFDEGDTVVLKYMNGAETDTISASVIAATPLNIYARQRYGGRITVIQLDGISSGGAYRLVSHTKVKP
jgi:hypothetical protein